MFTAMSNQVTVGTAGGGGAPFLSARSAPCAAAASEADKANPRIDDRKPSEAMARTPLSRCDRAFTPIKRAEEAFQQGELFGSLPGP